jgi:hypothetical protein
MLDTVKKNKGYIILFISIVLAVGIVICTWNSNSTITLLIYGKVSILNFTFFLFLSLVLFFSSIILYARMSFPVLIIIVSLFLLLSLSHIYYIIISIYNSNPIIILSTYSEVSIIELSSWILFDAELFVAGGYFLLKGYK